jgi:hypothetical protein
MRFYAVQITDGQGNIYLPNVGGNPGFSLVPYQAGLYTYSSLLPGATVSQIGGANRAALLFECDIGVSFGHAPGLVMPWVKIHGIGLGEVGQAANLNGAFITVYGGMSAGLPLANYPDQSGPLFTGQIWQCFGNWVGTDMSLSIYIAVTSSPSSNQTTAHPVTSSTLPGPNMSIPGFYDTPANLVFAWYAGQPLLQALVQCLKVAYPQLSILGAVSSNLVWSGAPSVGYFQTFKQLAYHINTSTLNLLQGYAPPIYVSNNPQYPGVQICINSNGEIVITDTTTQTTPKQILVQNMIGQPSWSKPGMVQVITQMRADLSAGDYVVLPDVPGITTAGSNSQTFEPAQYANNPYSSLKNSSIFQGTFQVNYVRHVGNSRQPDGTSWCTTFDIMPIMKPVSVVDQYPVLSKGDPKYGYNVS